MDKPLNIKVYDRKKDALKIKELAASLRQADREELTAIGVEDFEAALKLSLDTSDHAFLVMTEDQRMICIFGISLIETEYGRGIWFLGSELLREYRREFLTNSYAVLEQWKKQYGKLYNYVSCNNKKTIRWLKWLGANLSEPFPLGAHNEHFILFTLTGGEKDVR